MAQTLQLEIVTPEAIVYSEQVEMVTLPGVEGEMGIFPLHVSLMTQVVPGEITIRKAGKEERFAVGEGFVQITGDRVSILSDMAVKADQIDEAAVEEARRRAQARLQEKLTDEESALVSAALAHSLVQLRVKRRRSQPPGSS